MNTVFDPTVLFITESEWYDLRKRDGFLEHLAGNLQYIREFIATKVYWTDELEELLWNDPLLPPWRHDKDWKNKIVPVIYKRFQGCKLLVNLPHTEIKCSVLPQFKCTCCKLDAHRLFMGLMDYALVNQEYIYLCVGIGNRLTGEQNYRFFDESDSYSLVPELINIPEDWLKHVNFTEAFWPQSYSKEDLDKLHTALAATAELFFARNMNEPFQYEIEFERPFIEAISDELNNRQEILIALVKRLMRTQQEASADKGLNDEPVRGRRKERRFRVSIQRRIHYRYGKTGKIVFLKYYREGRHDEGL
jgi:hypothetical protein